MNVIYKANELFQTTLYLHDIYLNVDIFLRYVIVRQTLQQQYEITARVFSKITMR